MKRRLLGGLVAVLLTCQAATPVWAAGRAKVAVGKKPRAAKAEPQRPVCAPEAPRAAVPLADATALRLSLSTSLRGLPATTPAPTAAPSSAPIVAIAPATTPPPLPDPSPVAASAPALPPAPGIRNEPASPARTPMVAPAAPPTPVYTPRPYPVIGGGSGNPYLPVPAASVDSKEAARQTPSALSGSPFSGLAQSIPLLPDSGQSILPKITKVYPTGEKPLVVVSFKCPTEVVGITPPTIKILHEAVSLGMAGINKTDLLSFDLQQVCQ